MDTQRKLSLFLFINAFMVLVMIVLGGVTRLTGSGLSMVVWEPITGALPPLNVDQWQAVFEAYQTSPEFKSVNYGMTLNEFKGIFWLEYIHRLWGRILGLTVFGTFAYSLFHKEIRHYAKAIFLIFVLGGLQGIVGWYMVKSGLVKDPHVSPYRLMFHLLLGTLSLILLLKYAFKTSTTWRTRMDLIQPQPIGISLLALLAGLTFLWGALVAGFKAGLIYNTFPKMNDQWFPEDMFFHNPLWLNFVANPTAIQWTHRTLAVLTLIATWTLIRVSINKKITPQTLSYLQILGGLSLLQVFLGIVTLLHMVPVTLGAIHQFIGVCFITILVLGWKPFASKKI